MKRVIITPLLLTVLAVIIPSACKNRNGISQQAVILSSGSVSRIENFPSSNISPRNVDVWVPGNYRPGGKYRVLYMHDGQMLFDSTTTWNHQEWGVDETMGGLIEEGEIDNTIVVGIWNTEKRFEEYCPQKPFEMIPLTFFDSLRIEAAKEGIDAPALPLIRSDNYLRFIVEELKPYIDSHWSTLKGPESTFIAGSSMGGLISMYAICEYPDIFGGAVCMSTHWPGAFDFPGNPCPVAFREYMRENLPDPGSHKIYFDYGTETLDSLYQPLQELVDRVMEEKGYDESNWLTMKFEGDDHSENSWRSRLNVPLRFLLASK